MQPQRAFGLQMMLIPGRVIFIDHIVRHSQGLEGIRLCGLKISSLLFVDNVVLSASSCTLGGVQLSVNHLR